MKVIIVALGALPFALCYSASARQVAKTHRIGYLTAASLTAISPRIEAFRHGLRELGYVEGEKHSD